jgi:hypothetical protein
MDDTRPTDPFLEWGLGTFHTLIFILALVILLFFIGSLGSILSGLNTLVGYALFTALWGTTWWTTSRALRKLNEGHSPVDILFSWPVGIFKFTTLGVVWGGINGILFAVVLFIAVAIFVSPQVFLSALFVLPFAFIVGAIFGILLILIDSLALSMARLLVKRYIRTT